MPKMMRAVEVTKPGTPFRLVERAMPVEVCVAMTLAFGIEAPVESVTVPVSVAVTTWAFAWEKRRNARAKHKSNGGHMAFGAKQRTINIGKTPYNLFRLVIVSPVLLDL